MVTKKTKRGEKKMDLKPLVYGLSICPEGDGEMEGPRLFMKISTGSAANVKPEQVLDAYYGFLGKERPPFAFMVQREEVYTCLLYTSQQFIFCAGGALGNKESDKLIGGELPVPCQIGVRIGKFGDYG